MTYKSFSNFMISLLSKAITAIPLLAIIIFIAPIWVSVKLSQYNQNLSICFLIIYYCVFLFILYRSIKNQPKMDSQKSQVDLRVPTDKKDDEFDAPGELGDTFRGINKIKSKKWGPDQIEDFFYGCSSLLGLIFLFLAIASPICILLYQFYGYLKIGIWQSLSIIDVIKDFNTQSAIIQWAISPTDWLGLWTILNSINIAIPIFLVSAFLSIVFFNISDKR